MSLNGAIDDHATGVYTVRRQAAGPFVKGKPTLGAASTFTCTASVQPFEGDMKELAEGQRTDLAKTIYAYAAQGFHARTTTAEPDVFELEDGDYSVEKCLKWDHWGETHYVITAYKLDPL